MYIHVHVIVYRSTCTCICILSLSFSLSLPPSLPPSLPSSFPPSLQPPAVEDEKDLEDLKDRAQVRLLLWLEMESKKSKFAEEMKLIGGEFSIYAETVSGVCILLCIGNR